MMHTKRLRGTRAKFMCVARVALGRFIALIVPICIGGAGAGKARQLRGKVPFGAQPFHSERTEGQYMPQAASNTQKATSSVLVSVVKMGTAMHGAPTHSRMNMT